MEKSENKHCLQKGSSAQVQVKYRILWKHTCLPDSFGRAVAKTHCCPTKILLVWFRSRHMLCLVLQDLLLGHLARSPRPCWETGSDALHHCYKEIAPPAFHPCLTFQETHILQMLPLNSSISCTDMTLQLSRLLTYTLSVCWVLTNSHSVLSPL